MTPASPGFRSAPRRLPPRLAMGFDKINLSTSAYHMPKSTSRQVSMARIEALGDLGVIVIRLMTAVSDLMHASQALGVWNDERDPARERLKGSARRYFVRLQIGHLYEALKTIDDIQKNHADTVKRCDRETRNSFARVAAYFSTREYEAIAGMVRNNVVFHYGSSKMIARALKAIAARHGERKVWIDTGRELHHYNYDPSTWVLDQITLRQIFKISADVDASEAADQILVQLMEIQEAFSDFAVHFIDHHTRS